MEKNLLDLALLFHEHFLDTIIFRRKWGESADYPLPGNRMLVMLHHQQPCTLKKLCHILGVTTASGSMAVEKMVKSGLVNRVQDATDRRKVSLSLTAAGEAVVQKDLDNQYKCFATAFSNLKPKEQERLAKSLKTASSILERLPLPNPD
jgi:DNA-binding MarR family transcriptional regulator